MENTPEPLDAFRADVEHAAQRRWRDFRWCLRKFVGAQLLKLVGAGTVGFGLLWATLPL